MKSDMRSSGDVNEMGEGEFAKLWKERASEAGIPLSDEYIRRQLDRGLKERIIELRRLLDQ